MKKTTVNRSVLAISLMVAGAVHAASVILDENTPDKVAGYIGMDQSDPADGKADNGIASATNINFLLCGQTKSSKLGRGVLMFDVRGLPTVTSAVLKFKLNGRSGRGVLNAEPSTDLQIFAGYTQSFGLSTPSVTGKDLMYSSLFADTGLRLSKTSEPGWYSLDVTPYVTHAAASGRLVAFRFQMENDIGLAFGINDYYSIPAYRNPADAPELVLELSATNEPIIVGDVGSDFRLASKN